MSVKQINNHYSMNNPASVYDEEALTVLELAGRLANKIVEIIDLVNQNEITIDEAVKEFERDYAEAKQYMVDNLPVFVENSVENMKNSGTLETLLLRIMESKKVDKGGIEQITYSMLSQEVKEMFTGGNTPVVDENSVSTSNIVDTSISEVKFHKNLRECVFYSAYEKGYFTPLIIVNTETGTAQINPNFDSGSRIINRETSYTFNLSNLVVDYSGWTTKPNFDIYLDTDNHLIKIVTATKSTSYSDYLYLGGIFAGGYVHTNVIPIQVNKNFFFGNGEQSFSVSPLALYSPSYYSSTLAKYNATDALFNFNFDTGEITMNKTTGSVLLPVQGRSYSLNFATLQVECEHSTSGSTYGVYFNPYTNVMYFLKPETTKHIDRNNCLYLGLITKEGSSACSTCVFPYTVNNGKYYIHPLYKKRPLTRLMLASGTTGGNIYAKVDFTNRQLIIPSYTALTYVLGNEYIHCENDNGETDIVIPFADAESNYQYLVGGVNGLKFVTYSEFIEMKNVRDVNQLYWLGYVNEISKNFDLTFNAVKCKTYGVLGDSISTFLGVIPEEHTSYYDGSNGGITTPHHTWWGRVADRCGLQLSKNLAWSGMRVTPRSSNRGRDGISFAGSNFNADIIFVYIGINDFNNEIPIGEIDYSENYLSSFIDYDKTHTFAQSYLYMLCQLKLRNPNSEIYCLTLPQCQRTDSTSGLELFAEHNGAGVWLWEYNDAIRKVCKIANVNVIDTDKCKFTQINSSLYFTDAGAGSIQLGFLHPNAEGMKVIANKVIKSVLDTEECE